MTGGRLWFTGLHIFFTGSSPLSRLVARPVTLACANVVNDRYCYIRDLLQMAATSMPRPGLYWPVYRTPIQLQRLVPFLDSHPDRHYAAYIWDGLTNGFRIGYDHRSSPLRSQGANHPSVLANPTIVEERIKAEVSAGRPTGRCQLT